MRSPSEIPHKADKFLGIAFGGVRDFIDNFGTGANFVKIPLYLSGLSVLTAYAPYAVSAGGVFAGLCFAKVAYDEHVANKKEHEKVAKRVLLDKQLELAQAETLETITKEFTKSEDIRRVYIREAFENHKKESEIHASVNNAIKQKIVAKYPSLLSGDVPSKARNKLLLQCLLEEYLNTFGENPGVYRKQNGKYPFENNLTKVIQKVTGLNPRSPNFHPEVFESLKRVDLREKYLRMFPEAANMVEPARGSFIIEQVKRFRAFFKRQKKLRYVLDNAFGFLMNVASGAGLSASLMRLFGVLAAGAPISWPLMIVVAVGGLVFGGVSLTYALTRGKQRKANNKSLDQEIAAAEVELELTNQLRKFYKNRSKLTLRQSLGTTSRQKQERPQPKVDYPLSMLIRMGIGVASKVIVGMATAVAVGLGIAFVASVFFPALPILAPTLAIGGGFSAYYIYKFVKDEVDSIKKEVATMQEVAELKQSLFDRYKDNAVVSERVHLDLQKDNRTLLKEVINDYLEFIQTRGGNQAKNLKGKYPKQEKIFKLLEDLTGAKRTFDEKGRLHRLGDDKFYNEIAKYLKGKDQSQEALAAANSEVQKLKSLFVTQNDPAAGLTTSPVNANDPAINKKVSLWKKGLNFLKDHGIGFASIACMAIVIPLFLAGPQAMIVAPVAAVVIGGYLIGKVVSHFSAKKQTALNQEKGKYSAIARKFKLKDKIANRPTQNQVLGLIQEHEEQVKERPVLAVKSEVRTTLPLVENFKQKDRIAARPLSQSLAHVLHEDEPHRELIEPGHGIAIEVHS